MPKHRLVNSKTSRLPSTLPPHLKALMNPCSCELDPGHLRRDRVESKISIFSRSLEAWNRVGVIWLAETKQKKGNSFLIPFHLDQTIRAVPTQDSISNWHSRLTCFYSLRVLNYLPWNLVGNFSNIRPSCPSHSLGLSWGALDPTEHHTPLLTHPTLCLTDSAGTCIWTLVSLPKPCGPQ